MQLNNKFAYPSFGVIWEILLKIYQRCLFPLDAITIVQILETCKL